MKPNFRPSITTRLGHLMATARRWPLFIALVLAALPARAAGIQQLHGHVPLVVKSLSSLGDFTRTNRLHLAIGLPLRNQTALTRLLGELYDPASPNYHHYLTPSEFAAQYGPTAADYQKVIDFARENGLTVTGTHPNRTLVDVSGNVADINRTFHVRLQSYQHPDEARRFFAPDVEPTVAAGLPILSVCGLNNYYLAKPQYHDNSSKVKPGNRLSTGSSPSTSYWGYDFRKAYAPNVTLTGTGQSVALFECDGYYVTDVTSYLNASGVPAVTRTNVLVDGASGAPSGTGGEVEVALDIDMANSMAPGLSRIIVYEAPDDTPAYNIIQLNQIATDDFAKQISSSWVIDDTAQFAQIYQQFATQGQSFFQASGDEGAYYSGIFQYEDSPLVTIVGGTTLVSTGTGGVWNAETVWNSGGGSAGGGGISTTYTIPSWQTNISMAANQGSTTMRNIPDVALTANNIYIWGDGSPITDVGGTSCAAPLWAGFMALVNQQIAANGGQPVGFPNPAIYALGKSANYPNLFHDITTGNNTNLTSTTKYYAATGYDLCTGWGTPAGQALINALANTEALQITPAAGFTSSGGLGGPFTVTSQTLTLTNAGTNALVWSLSNTSAWLTVSSTFGALAPGGAAAPVTASLNSAANGLGTGVYNSTLRFTNLTDGVGQGRLFTLSVISPPVITSQPANQAVLGGATAMFTVSATGGLPLNYQWQHDSTNLTDGGSLSGSATTNLVINNVSAANVGGYTVMVTNAAGSVTSFNALLTITPSAPVIVLQPTNQTVLVGTSVTFSLSADGSPPLTYYWLQNGTPITGATNPAYTINNAPLADSGSQFSCQVSNAFGGSLSSNAVLTVINQTAGELTTTYAGGNGYAGNMFDLIPKSNSLGISALDVNITPAGFAATVTVYYYNGTSFGHQTSSAGWTLLGSQTVTAAGAGVPTHVNLGGNGVQFQPGQTYGIYVYVNFSAGAGMTYTTGSNTFQNADVKLIADCGNSDPPFSGIFTPRTWNGSVYYNVSGATPPAITSQPQNVTVGAGGTAAFAITATGSQPLGYSWMCNNSAIAGATNSTFTTNNVQLPNSGSQFSCLVSNAAGTLLSSNALLTVTPVNANVITFDDLTGTVGAVPAGYHGLTWNNLHYQYALASGMNSGYYAGMISASNIVFNPNGTNASIASATPVNLVSGWLTAAWNDNLQFEAIGYNGTTVLYDNTWTLSATAPTLINFNYSGVTQVTFISSGGTKHTGYAGKGNQFVMDNLSVSTGASGPVITQEPTNQTIYTGGTAAFTVAASGTPPLAYQWTLAGTNLDGATNTTLSLTNVQLGQAGDYIVLVTNNYGSAQSSDAYLVVNPWYHFVWNQLASPQFVNTPFAVVIQAQDPNNNPASDFTNSVSLSTVDGTPVLPAVSDYFVQGTWTGTVTVAQSDAGLVLQAVDNLGDTGLANPVDIDDLPLLTIGSSAGAWYVSWPVNPAGFALETSPSLAPANWQSVTDQPVQVGDQYTLPIPTTGTNAFYQLQYSPP